MAIDKIAFEFVPKKVSEEELIDLFLDKFLQNNKRTDLAPFQNVLNPYSKRNLGRYEGVYFSKMIRREELKLTRLGKPGDVDVLLVPYQGTNIFFEESAAFEVKVVRPTIDNPNRNANSFGRTQIKGLIEDGFPLIGLIHVCVPEPLPPEFRTEIMAVKSPLNIHVPNGNKEFNPDDFDLITYDWFPGAMVDKQMQRLLSFKLPRFVGLLCFALSFNRYDEVQMIKSMLFLTLEKGSFNTKVRKDTIEKIKQHFTTNRVKRYTKVRFIDRRKKGK